MRISCFVGKFIGIFNALLIEFCGAISSAGLSLRKQHTKRKGRLQLRDDFREEKSAFWWPQHLRRAASTSSQSHENHNKTQLRVKQSSVSREKPIEMFIMAWHWKKNLASKFCIENQSQMIIYAVELWHALSRPAAAELTRTNRMPCLWNLSAKRCCFMCFMLLLFRLSTMHLPTARGVFSCPIHYQRVIVRLIE
jgi:hypothetical protein